MPQLKSLQEIENAKELTGYRNLTTSGGNQNIKDDGGYLQGVTVNASPTSAIRLYDGTTSAGTTIATIPASVAAGTFYEYGVAFADGLTVSSGHVGSMDITLIYR